MAVDVTNQLIFNFCYLKGCVHTVLKCTSARFKQGLQILLLKENLKQYISGIVEFMEFESVLRQLLAALLCSIGYVITGSLIAWPSPVLLKIRETGQPMELTVIQISWIVSLLYFGNFVSPIPAGYMMDYFGRRNTLLILSCLPMAAWIMTYFARSAEVLYGARFLAGMWNGAVSTIVPTYIAEISQSIIRGFLTVVCYLMGSISMLSVFVVGPRVSYEELAMIYGVFPLVFVCTFSFMPESPYYLIMRNRRRAAAKALMWLRGKRGKAINAELKRVVKNIQKEMKAGRSFRVLFSKRYRRALVMVEIVTMLQSMSGLSALIAYASTTLPPEGAGSLSPNDCIIVLGTLWVITVFLAALLIDNVGRKPLLIMSSAGCGIAMLIAGLWFLLNDQTTVDVYSFYWVPFAAMILYGVAFSMGLGPVPGTMQGEVFPSNIKALAGAVTVEVLALTSFIFNQMYYPLKEEVGSFVNFFIFSTACFICMLFAIFVVIETKGKSLTEIHDELG